MTNPRLNRGYTLMEILLALGIFAIGFVAVAAMFPAAAYLQKQTVQDVASQEFARTAEAMVLGRPFVGTDLDAVVGLNDGNLKGLPSDWLETPAALPQPDDWTLYDRSYPTLELNLANRSYVWVPLVRYTTPLPVGPTGQAANWQVFIFVLRREIGASYASAGAINANDVTLGFPGVYNENVGYNPGTPSELTFQGGLNGNNDTDGDGVGDIVAEGDSIVDNNGSIYIVKSADDDSCEVEGVVITVPGTPTSIYYSAPGTLSGGGSTGSPCKRIVLIGTGGVK